MDKQHLRDLLEIQTSIDWHIKRLSTSGYPKKEQAYRKEELKMILFYVHKIRKARLKPIESLQTVRGVSYKIGDKFHIAGDEISTYTIVLFPDTVTIRGEASNPAIGKPWTCEVYLENAVKIKKVKPTDVAKGLYKSTKRIKLEKKRKPVKIKEGKYFAICTNNTIYLANEVSKKMVTGTNELKSRIASKYVKADKRDIILKTKKEYKKQHKAERKYKG